jgi:diguanylate cyclase (GGDEF)-like protein
MRAPDHATRRRADAIAQLGLLERAGDPALSGITRVAAYVSGAAAAAVHILDEDHQHRIAGHGAALGDHPRDDSMCHLVVDSAQRVVCADATEDPRFGFSSFVQGPDPVRFYASVPLRASGDVVVGTLCAFDTTPRTISDAQVALLEDLAEQVVSTLELKRIARDLGHVASHDALTGAVNRLVLGDRLAQAFARRLRGGGETFVALCDIDDFKTINDTHGHAAGDEVLVEVADRLRRALRPHDTVARIGGDEFVVVAELPGMTHVDLGARLDSALAAPVRYDGEDRVVRVSVGCVMAEPGEDVRDVLVRADAAMYREKSTLAA